MLWTQWEKVTHHCFRTRVAADGEECLQMCVLSRTPSVTSSGSFPPKFPLKSHVRGQVASHCCSCRVKTGRHGVCFHVSRGIESLSPNNSFTFRVPEGQNSGGLTMAAEWGWGLPTQQCGWTLPPPSTWTRIRWRCPHVIWVSNVTASVRTSLQTGPYWEQQVPIPCPQLYCSP